MHQRLGLADVLVKDPESSSSTSRRPPSTRSAWSRSSSSCASSRATAASPSCCRATCSTRSSRSATRSASSSPAAHRARAPSTSWPTQFGSDRHVEVTFEGDQAAGAGSDRADPVEGSREVKMSSRAAKPTPVDAHRSTGQRGPPGAGGGAGRSGPRVPGAHRHPIDRGRGSTRSIAPRSTGRPARAAQRKNRRAVRSARMTPPRRRCRRSRPERRMPRTAGAWSPPRSSPTTSSSVRFLVLLILLGLRGGDPALPGGRADSSSPRR